MNSKHLGKGSGVRCISALLLAASFVATASAGCDGSSDERGRASELAGGCSINSDCAEDLICAFERCHEACTQDRDCDADLRCVKSEVTDVFVCQLDDETVCKADKDCPGDQVCGIDEECRDSCKMGDDCIADQVCDPSGECASTAPGKDLLDGKGRLIAADSSGPSGSGGAAGDGPLPGQGGQNSGTGNGGAPGMTSAGTNGMVNGGASTGGSEAVGGDTSSAGSGTSTEGGASGYPPAEYEEEPGAVETVANDFREDAIPVTEAVNIYLSEKRNAGLAYDQDSDWFSFSTPDDGHSHIITVRMQQEANLHMRVSVQAAADGSSMGSQELQQGTLRYVYVTAGPNSTTLFRFSNIITAGSKGMAFITFEDTVENDDHEPNNDKTSASPIQLGTSVSGLLLSPFVSEIDQPNQDWYALDLALGTTTVTLSAAPTDGRLAIDILRPNEGQAKQLISPAIGSTGAWPFTVTTAGTHYISIRPSASGSDVACFEYLTQPNYMTQQYSFTVSQ